jgi:membrane protease YdiL (CAAX protease family)
LEHLDSQVDDAAMTAAVTRRWCALAAMVLAGLPCAAAHVHGDSPVAFLDLL